MKHHRLPLALGLFILLVFVAFALFPNAFTQYDLKQMSAPWQNPSSQHLLGTNDMGYDIFTEIIYASGSTLWIGLAAACISLFLGTSIGVLAGYLPGWLGEAGNGIIQIFLMIPMLPMAIVIAAFFGTSTSTIIWIIAILGWCGTARTVRVRTMQLKQTPFVEALIILGISKLRIMVFHILPNLYEVILSRYIMSVTRCIMLEATLSFLGLGNPTAVTWGRMMNLAYRQGGFTRGAYHWLVSPGVCIALIVMAFYFINYGLEAKNNQVSGAQSYLD